ncbi:MAG: MglA protein [Deltaproteobacteria bacterium]|nr:MglA protein [Deltaproteobacteria bacterium]
MQYNPGQRELTLKVVYYGPALSGKTTNLQMLHQLLDPQVRGRLMSLDTADDRTLFFDLLPVFFHTYGGLKIKIKVYTVPGQVMHHSTRRIVLSGADAVAFIADSQLSETRANTDAWNSMIENMRETALDPTATPVVLQFNKRDMPHVRSDADIDALRASAPHQIFTATAIRGEGVLETLCSLLQQAFRRVAQQHDVEATFGLGEAEFLRTFLERLAPAHADRLASLLAMGDAPRGGTP